MNALVTGGAGFIGSHLVEALTEGGHAVRVVDCLTDYYDVRSKEANLAGLAGRAEVLRADLRTDDLAPLLDEVDVVFHQAGQPGVRLSWAEGFPAYESNNVLATQRLLEAARGATSAHSCSRPARRSTATPSGSRRPSRICPGHGAPTA